MSIACLYHLRQFHTICHLLYPHAISTRVHALIHTRVDFCNTIYPSISSLNISKLLSTPNTADCLTGGLPKLSDTYVPLSHQGSSFLSFRLDLRVTAIKST